MPAISIVANPNLPPNRELMLALTGLLVSLWLSKLTNYQPLAVTSSIGFFCWVLFTLPLKRSGEEMGNRS
jgi:hypothetical protein